MDNSTTKYESILRANGILEKIDRVTVQESGAKGDGLASLTLSVTVEFEKETNRKPLQLFIKTHTENPSHEDFIGELRYFEKETQFFMEYLPDSQRLCQKNGLKDLMNIYPKCYYADSSIIVLENLVLERGYEMHSRDKRHDFETTTVVLDSLAKHHGISYAMIRESGGSEAFCEKYSHAKYDAWMSTTLLNIMEGFYENSLKSSIAVLEKTMGNSGKDFVEKLKSFQGKSRQMTIECLQPNKDDQVLVLIHGDYKNNNMLFRKSNETNKNLEHIIIDFQIYRYNAPALDLVYYLFSSVDHKLRQSRLKELLCTYMSTFNKTCKDLGYPVNLSYEDLLRQYKGKLILGLLFGLIMAGPGMSLVKTSDDIDVSKMNVTELADLFDKNMLKWIEQNPEKGKELAEEIIGMLKEYENLSTK